MRAITGLSVFLLFLVSGNVNGAGALLYLDPKDKSSFEFKSILHDSIPLLANERVVLESKDVVARWVVALVRVPYEQVWKQIEQSVRERSGIEAARERSVKIEDFSRVNPHVPEDPLFGDGFSGFHQVVSDLKIGREYKIVSKQYNRIAKVDGYSVSTWRIGNGRDLFGEPCSVIVVQRADYSSEWARDHTGIPWPFKTSGTTPLVTETEITLIERLKKENKGVSIQYFVPYPAYMTDSVLKLMNSIHHAATKRKGRE